VTEQSVASSLGGRRCSSLDLTSGVPYTRTNYAKRLRANVADRICARRHSRFSDNDSRPFWFHVPTKTLSHDLCATITIHHCCLDTCGPCSNEHYLGHAKNVYDDDDAETANMTLLLLLLLK